MVCSLIDHRNDVKMFKTLQWNHLPAARGSTYVLNILTSFLWSVRVQTIENGWPGGAGSEVWNRVYMIALVKKFGRARLNPIFLQNKYGGECRHGRAMSFCAVLSFSVSKHQEKVFINVCNGIFGHQEAWCTNSSWVTSVFGIRHLGKFSYF